MKHAFFICILFVCKLASADQYDLPNFHKVDDGIFRSGRPSSVGLQDASKLYGVKTIIDLENSTYAIQQESDFAKKLGLKFISMPMSSMTAPNDAEVTKIEKLLNDKTIYPVLVHCKLGMDRTGLIIGLHRVFTDHWDAKVAYQEMLKYGFHPEFLDLVRYYKQKTGMQ